MYKTPSVDKVSATKELADAYHKPILPSSEHSIKIEKIVNGSHKTYKYVFITALLAKAVNNETNPLSLQAGANLQGAFDARSLAHNVLVPFERAVLHNALGGSNEPYLNKPARFKTISVDNAVRRGSDREILSYLVEILSSIKTSTEAKKILKETMFFVKVKAKEIEELNSLKSIQTPITSEILEFINKFIFKSYEGETLVLVVATLEELFTKNWKQKVVVKAHKVNQSGASSKEIGDIDVYIDGKLFYSIEVKDKDFSDSDYQHAARKVIDAGGSKLLFVFGALASFDKEAIQKTEEDMSDSIIISTMNILDYAKLMIIKTNTTESQKFLNTLMDKAHEINAKESTKLHIKELSTELGWL